MAENEEFITESVLGTHEYWENFYEEELENFCNHGDEGESWFGKGNTMKIVNWLNENINKNSKICDLGCGNGVLLGKLYEKGFTKLTGLDYSEKSIILAIKIHFSKMINFKNIDILTDFQVSEEDNFKFDVIIDKGTYDAIALMPNTDIQESRSKYKSFLDRNLNHGGFFVLMSCNFTLDEIGKFLLNSNESFERLKFENEYVFEMSKLQFGGVTGQQVVGVVFKRI